MIQANIRSCVGDDNTFSGNMDTLKLLSTKDPLKGSFFLRNYKFF